MEGPGFPLVAEVEGGPAAPTWPLGGFNQWYVSEYTAMVRLAFLLVGSPEMAEEVAQEAFAAVLERFDHLDNPGGYLRRCVVNGGREVQRKRDVARRHPSPEPGPAALGADHVIEVVRGLPYRQRAVVVLRFYSGMNLSEISDALALPLGTVKSPMHRAVRHLREELGE